MGSIDQCICVEFPEVLVLPNTIQLGVLILLQCTQVRVMWAHFNAMTQFAATCTAHIFHVGTRSLAHLATCKVSILFFREVLRKFAARLLFAFFSAAPPHEASPITLVRSARPVEIFFLNEFFATNTARLDAGIDLTFTRNQFVYTRFEFLLLRLQTTECLFIGLNLPLRNIGFFLSEFNFVLQGRNFFLIRNQF